MDIGAVVGDVAKIISWVFRAGGSWLAIYGAYVVFSNWNEHNPEAMRKGATNLIMGVAIFALSTNVEGWIQSFLTFNG